MLTPRQSPPVQAAQLRPTLLLVDDDPLIVDALAFSLRQHFSIRTANTRQQALDALEREAPPALALIDLGLPPQPHRPDEGFALIKELLARAPQTRVLVLSGQSDDAHGRRARTLGAIEFIAKPCDPGTVLRHLNAALAITNAADGPLPARGLIGSSPPLQKLRAQLAQFAESPFPVLIEGESGSGKEIIAREHLHANTRRAPRPFLALNCAAISPSLVEPTLFGHAKGAFTGASGARAGYFEDVEDGTLFLDEIGELPLDLQAKLLRVLENGEFQRVGETQTRRARARVVAATNRDLHEEMRAGRFRVDLYHRLSVFTLNVPPLREMGEDRQLLLEHFRAQYAEPATGTPAFTLDEGARRLWSRYHFPGNVRELRNIVIRLTAKYAGQSVNAAQLENELDLPAATFQTNRDSAGPVGPTAWAEQARRLLGEASAQGQCFDLDGCLRSIERSLLDAALEISQGNVSQAARLLGVSRTTLYSRIDRTDGEA
jgi:DNA-binding NtrC family response regulator